MSTWDEGDEEFEFIDAARTELAKSLFSANNKGKARGNFEKDVDGSKSRVGFRKLSSDGFINCS
jgi:hypothetical protein